MWKTTREIITLANGGARWRKGEAIAPGVLPDAQWQRLLEEGAVVETAAPLSPVSVVPVEVDATPRAVELAEELGVDLAAVQGSGADGRIIAGDVRSAAEE